MAFPNAKRPASAVAENRSQEVSIMLGSVMLPH